MKLTVTTLVLIEDTSDNSTLNESSILYHSFQEDPEKAKSEIIADVNQVYAPDVTFKTIEEIQEYFDYVHLECQEITLRVTNALPSK